MSWREPFQGLRVRNPFTKERKIDRADQYSLGRQAYLSITGADMPDTNPDTVIAKKGISVYREMFQRDEQIKAAILFKALARLSTGYEIIEGKDGDPDKRDFCIHQIEQMDGSMNQLVKAILDGMVMGFSAVEKIWGEPYERGPFAGKRGFRRYHSLLQEYTEIKSDRYGEIEEDGIWQHQPMDRRPDDGPNKGQYIALPKKDFIVFSNNKTGDNWHGESDLRAAYRFYVLKDVGLRSWGYYTETYGQPFLWAEEGTGSGNVGNQILEVLEKLRKAGSAVFPRGTKINMQLPTMGASSRENFSKIIDTCNRGEARAILLPSLLMEHGDVGSYALGESHTDQFVWVLEDLGETIEEILAEQYFKPLIDMNWAQTDVYPRLKFNGFKRDDLKILMEVTEKLVNKGLPVGQTWAYEKFGVPKPTDDEEVLSQGAAPGQGLGRPKADGTGPLGLAPPGEGVVPNPDDEGAPEKELAKAGWEVSAVMAGDNGKSPVVFATKKRWREPTSAEIQVDFDQVENQADRAVSGAGENIALVIDITREKAVNMAKGKDPTSPFPSRK